MPGVGVAGLGSFLNNLLLPPHLSDHTQQGVTVASEGTQSSMERPPQTSKIQEFSSGFNTATRFQ